MWRMAFQVICSKIQSSLSPYLARISANDFLQFDSDSICCKHALKRIFSAPATFLSASPKAGLEQGSFASKRALIAPISAPVRNHALEALQVREL
jgi:hypothetical protein